MKAILVGSKWRARYTGFVVEVVAVFGGVMDAVKVKFDRGGVTRIFSACDLRRGFVED